MQSIVDVSAPVCEPAGTKRAASQALSYVSSYTPEPRQLLPHGSPCPIGQTCSCKRQRISNQYPFLNTQYSPSASAGTPPIIRHDTRNREFEMVEKGCKLDYKASNPRGGASNLMTKTATPFASTQGSNLLSGLAAPDSEPLDQLQEQPSAGAPSQTEEIDAFTRDRMEAVKSRSDRGLVGPHQRKIDHCSEGHTRIHNFYTKASILSPRGIVDFQRVQVDERSSFNLLPWSIAMDLGLLLYFDKTLTTTIADCIVQTNQYCQFNIRVAGVDTRINTGVIYGLQTVLLGQEWIQSVCLLSGLGNQSYYILIPLAVEAAEERFSNVEDAKVKAQNTEDYDDNERGTVDCGNDFLSDSGLSSSKPLSNDERPSGGDLSDNELSLDGGLSSDGEISSGEELNFEEYELAPTDDDDDDRDYGNYEDDEGKEREEGEDDTDANLQDFMEQHKHLEYHAEVQQAKAAREIAKMESEQKLHCLACLACLRDPLDRNESMGDPALNMGSQQSEPKGEQVFPNSHRIDSLNQSAAPSPTKSQVNGVQSSITKLQTKEIVDILNQIIRTQAGQSFKAPVEQLWPECADVYANKVPNPIDLGTMKMKVKNNMYPSLDDFRADAILIYENSLAFNGIDHIITSAALEVRDNLLKAISDMEEGKGSTILRASARKL